MLTPEGIKILKVVLSTIEIEEDEKTPTAEIRKNNDFYYIKIGKKFKETFLKTDEDYYFVLLHEYLHAFLSQFYLGRYYIEVEKEKRSILNFVFDSIVNYFIAKNLLLKEPPFLKKLYANLPYSLYIFLNPYEAIKKGELRKKLYTFLKKKKVLKPKEVAFWINSFLYSGKEDVHQFICFMESYLMKNFANIYTNIILIDSLKEFMEKIPEFLKKFYKKEAGYSEDEKIEKIKIEDRDKFTEETITTFKIALKKALQRGSGSVDDFKIEKVKSVVPFPGRRELLFIKRGIYPVFFKKYLRYKNLESKRPRVYIDVSGSTGKFWSFIYGICYFLRDLIGEPIYIFSNRVYEITLEELKEGKIKTTGGTDFDCVAKHILDNGFKKALIITDGYAKMRKNLQSQILKNRVEIYIILLGINMLNRDHYTDLKSFAKKIWCVSFK